MHSVGVGVPSKSSYFDCQTTWLAGFRKFQHWYDELCTRSNRFVDLSDYRVPLKETDSLKFVNDATLTSTDDLRQGVLGDIEHG